MPQTIPPSASWSGPSPRSSPEPATDTGASATVTVSVTRAAAKQDYTVPVEAVGRAARTVAETAGR